MRDHLTEIRAKGAELVVVGNGQPFMAKAFRDERELDFPLLVDPGLRAYKAAGLKRGRLATLNPAVALRAARAMAGGFSQTAVEGDPWQQGGAFVIAPPGEVRLAFVASGAGEHPDPRDLVAALG
ncbi:MAG: redoxin domain-containing protein [Planctomycetes bacterium]|nr:redoxin domain-containing protein [Planctomycetota bacterium]